MSRSTACALTQVLQQNRTPHRYHPSYSSYHLVTMADVDIVPQTVSNTAELVADLQRLYETRANADVRLIAIASHIEGGPTQEFEAHSSILIARSEYFRAMFTNGMRETREHRDRAIELRDCVPRAFEKVLQYAYTGSVSLSDDALGVMICASQVCVRKKERGWG